MRDGQVLDMQKKVFGVKQQQTVSYWKIMYSVEEVRGEILGVWEVRER